MWINFSLGDLSDSSVSVVIRGAVKHTGLSNMPGFLFMRSILLRASPKPSHESRGPIKKSDLFEIGINSVSRY